MDSPWIPPFIPPRPSTLGGIDPYKQWPVSPAAPSGTGMTSGYVGGAYQSLSGMMIENGKLYSVPGMSLTMDTTVGGNMVGVVQFFDDYVQTGQVNLATLTVNGVLIPGFTDYSFGADMTVSFTESGTYQGSWVTIPYDGSIPAGSGWLMSFYGSAGADAISVLSYPLPLDTNFSLDCTVSIEMADNDGNVLATVAIAQITLNQVYNGTSILEAKHLCSMYEPISWGGIIKKGRCTATATCSPGGDGFSASAGVSRYVGVRRRL